MRALRFTVLLMFFAFPVSSAWAGDDYAEAVQVFKNAGESGKFFKVAYGYAIFPNIGKGGFVVGGAHGSGRVYAGGKHVGNASMTQVSVGAQLGGQVFSEIVFFQDKRSFDEFTAGNYEFSAEASAVAITAAANATASTGGSSVGASGGQHDAVTDGDWHKGMAIFTVAKGGLMYQAAVGGQKFSYKPM
ncbi:MAG TPA: lipid-binding SYLF domain-containing protein [Pseudomonadales bacterium]|nr:lipid-binding SYLF domain-containing protein [Pseudomonadales bacterium]